MIITACTIVETARAWIGTPYVHQASTRGSGADCLGLVRGVWRELFGAEPEAVPAYTSDWSEPQREEALWVAATRHLLPLTLQEARGGDVLLLRMRDGKVAKHLGIAGSASGSPTIIHAFTGHGVVESALSQPWQRRIVAAFRFPMEAP